MAQGIEAGGHTRGRIGLLALLDEVLAAVRIPVIAAGGIGTGRAMAAMLVAGAEGVRIGTRFLAAEESGAHPAYVAALIDARAQDTAMTDAFSRGWPDAPHRTLTSCVTAAQAFLDSRVGERDSLDGTRIPAYRLAPLVVDRTTDAAFEAMPLWAGESVGTVKQVQTARQIVEDLAREASRCLGAAAALHNLGPSSAPPEVLPSEKAFTMPATHGQKTPG